MAKIIRKKARKSAPKRKLEIKKRNNDGFFSRIKFLESYTSLMLGALAVLVIAILILPFAKVNRAPQTSSVMDAPKTWEEISQNLNTSSTYTVNPGDDLWSISENVYNDGFKWVEIAKINKLENPSMIRAGEELMIPAVEPTVVPTVTSAVTPAVVASAAAKEKIENLEIAQAPQSQDTAIESNSITGNTYTVVEGDNLWDISVRAYGDGFRWPEIAKANSLVNPGIIHPGNVFVIPR